MHHQAGLNRHHRPIARIHSLNFLGYQPVADVIHPGTVIALNHRAQQPELAHLAENCRIGFFIPIGIFNPRQQLILCVLARRIANHPLFFTQLLFHQEGVLPIKLDVV